MNRRTALLLSGAVTAFLLMVVVGLVYGADRFSSAAAVASGANPSALAGVSGNSGDRQAANPADVAALQEQVQTLKSQLQQAYTDLQTAYDQISALQSQGTGGRFRNGGRDSSGVTPFGNQRSAPLLGGDD